MLWSLFALGGASAEGTGGYVYAGHGVDVSFPMHGPIPRHLPGAKAYDDFINGCAEKYSMRACKSNEDARISMNRLQVSRQRNYTELGFARWVVLEILAKSSAPGQLRGLRVGGFLDSSRRGNVDDGAKKNPTTPSKTF